MERVFKAIAYILPMAFALAFLVPVIAQGMEALGLAAPFGLTHLTFALIVGGGWGLFAQATCRWI
ncbi:hypothetical protein [Erythrobacter rubeus]|uniref:Uncharacterized protein n=1 Tax=Erythrobacter rubeus TaxID=2760803 RepID=A0ABR8KNM5_9SPHN|nr:hypothetical protein [Erythrobacter rubeus]MBD2840748.1 hypothetical protein [Erythrobacter rubeus]